MESRTDARTHINFSPQLVATGAGFVLLTAAAMLVLGIPGAALGVVAALGFVLALITFKNPWLGILFVTLSLPFERFGSLEVAGLTLRASQVFGALTVVAFAASLFLARNIRFRHHPGTLPLAVFLLTALASLLMAQNVMRGVMVFLFVLFTVLVHFLMPNLVTTTDRLKVLVKTLFIMTAIITVFGIFQFFGDVIGLPTSITGLRDLYTSDVFGFPRVQSTFLEPLYFANFLLIPIGLLLSYLFSSKRILRPLLLLPLLGLAVLNLVLTLSRGGYIGLVVTGFVVMVYSFRKVLTPSRIFFGGLLVVIMAYAFLQIFAFTGEQNLFLGRFVTQATDIFSGASYFDRASTFSQAIDLFQRSPWFGVGIGNFGPAVALHALQQPEGGWLIVNNEFLEILAETGILGFTAFLAFLAVLFFRSLRLLRTAMEETFAKRTLIGLFAAFLGILVQYQTFSILFIMHIWFLFGLLVAVQNLVEKERA